MSNHVVLFHTSGESPPPHLEATASSSALEGGGRRGEGRVEVAIPLVVLPFKLPFRLQKVIEVVQVILCSYQASPISSYTKIIMVTVEVAGGEGQIGPHSTILQPTAKYLFYFFVSFHFFFFASYEHFSGSGPKMSVACGNGANK